MEQHRTSEGVLIVGELIQLKDWEADRKRKATEESLAKIRNAVKNIEELLRDANSHRKATSDDRDSGKRTYTERPEFKRDSGEDGT